MLVWFCDISRCYINCSRNYFVICRELIADSWRQLDDLPLSVKLNISA